MGSLTPLRPKWPRSGLNMLHHRAQGCEIPHAVVRLMDMWGGTRLPCPFSVRPLAFKEAISRSKALDRSGPGQVASPAVGHRAFDAARYAGTQNGTSSLRPLVQPSVGKPDVA